MTKERREEILSKDILNVQDVQELTGKEYHSALTLIKNIKRRFNPAYNERGKVSTQDYLKFFTVERVESQKENKVITFRRQERKQAEVPLFRAKNFN